MIYAVHANRGVPPEQIARNGFSIKQNSVAFHGLCQVRALRDEYFGGPESRAFKSEILISPTWRKILAVAKKQMQATKDEHHVFLEGIEDTGQDDFLAHPSGRPVRILRLLLGS